MRKFWWGISLLIAVILVSYLLWPLSSDEFAIQWNDGEIKKKEVYLDQLPAGNPDQPNILLIIADDLGKFDMSMYGDSPVKTPHIDRLGKEGVIFDHAYVPSSVCSPSRAALFTGRYPQRFGFMYQMHEFYLANRLQYYGYKYLVSSYPWLPRGIESVPGKEEAGKQGMPPSEITLPEILSGRGYYTGLVGKWHMGVHAENTPCNFGFDYQYGFYASHSLYADEGQEGIVNQYIEEDFTDPFIWEGQRNGPHAIYRNCDEIEEDMYLTDAITRECKQFIKGKGKDPFFLIAAYNAPHTPLQAQREYVDKFAHIEDPVKRVYYAMIANLDDAIGDLNHFLEDEGLADNTLVIFISDNGGASYTHTTNNAPLTGGKITDFEGGVNVPMLMKWKGKIAPNSRYQPQVISMDIFSTIMGQLDIQLPENRIYDGVDLIPYINGGLNENPHEYLYWGRGPTRAIRSENYKMLWNEAFLDTLMFSMEENNFEQKNIADMNSIAREELLEAHKIWMGSLPEPFWPPLVNYAFEYQGKTYYFDN